MKALNDAYRKEKDPEKSTEIKDKMEPFYEEMGKITDRFIATHIDSYVTAGQLRYSQFHDLSRSTGCFRSFE